MKVYACRMLVIPGKGALEAWAVIYAQADSPADAAAAMLRHLEKIGWNVVRAEESGVIDPDRNRDPQTLRSELQKHGAYAVMYPDSADPMSRFSKN